MPEFERMSIDRRRFLTAAGGGLVASALPRGLLAAPPGRLGHIGVQLYTVRTLLARDFEGTLAQLARIGYREVEFAGYYDRSPGELRKTLDRLKLAAPAAHIPFEALRDEPNRAFDAAEQLGHRYLVVGWLNKDDRETTRSLVRTAAAFNRIGERARRRGLRFAYHNHDFEFTRIDGRVAYDVLLDDTDPALVAFEMDLFWVAKGGADALAYFERYPGRFPLVHVKDMAAGQRMVDVGQGHIDWRRIFGRRKQAGIRHFFVEHDEPADPIASVRASYQYLRALKF